MVSQYQPDLVLYFLSSSDFSIRTSDLLVPNLVFSNDDYFVDTLMDSAYLQRFQKIKDLQYHFVYVNMVNNCIKQHKRGLTYSKLFDKFYRGNTEHLDESGAKQLEFSSEELDLISKLFDVSRESTRAIIINRDRDLFPQQLLDVFHQKEISYIDLSALLLEMSNLGSNPYYWNVTNLG